MEPVPALVLLNLRRIAQDAARRRVKLDPQQVLAILDGRRA